MGLFGQKFDRKTSHIRTEVHGHKNFNTGKEIADRIKGEIIGEHITNRKLLQQNLYRVYRGQGYGVLESHKMAKSKASQEMLSQHYKNRYHKHHKHRKHYYR